MLELNRVHVGDIRALAPQIAPGSVNCIVTSPPYFGLRAYLDAAHPDKPRELGSEPTVGQFVANLVAVSRALRPALRDDGTLWVNLGDSYSQGGNGGGATCKQASNVGSLLPPKRTPGFPPKCLVMAPARFAIAMCDDGWVLRNDICWVKPNPMPESVTDRFSTSHEHVFLFAKRPDYWADMEAVREPHAELSIARAGRATLSVYAPPGQSPRGDGGVLLNAAGRNARDVWTIPTAGFPGAHYATFPPALVRRCIRAGCPPRVCAACGSPWVRELADTPAYAGLKAERGRWGSADGDEGRGFGRRERGGTGAASGHELAALGPVRVTLGWRATCACGPDAGTRPGVVLDPFMGSGTTALVAVQENRDWLGCDLDARSSGWTAGRLAGAQRRLPLDLAAAAAGG